MANMSDWLEGQIRAHIFRTATFTKPSALWVGLYTSDPGDASGGTEVSGGSYARVQLNPSDANWTAASSTDGVTNNGAVITYPAPTANWGTVTHFAIHTASTAGNRVVYGALSPSRVINSADAAPEFAVGALTVTFA